MKYRKLRIAFSAVCGIICLLLIALWVRSYWSYDGAVWQFAPARFISWHSQSGRIGIVSGSYENPSTFGSVASSDGAGILGSDSWFYADEPESVWVVFPDWFPIILFTAFATLPWIHGVHRFSLRTLLIAVTLLALTLGTIIATTR
jgi:hypothetical protein